MGTSAVGLPQGFELDSQPAVAQNTPTQVSGPQMTAPDVADQGFQSAPASPQAGLPSGFELDQPSSTPSAPISNPNDNSKPGFFQSFYDSTVSPLLKTTGGLITHSGAYDPENPLLQTIVNQVNQTGEKGQNAINILKTLPSSSSFADVVHKLDKAGNQALYAVPIIGAQLEGTDKKWAEGNYAGALGDVAGIAANLMAPEFVKDIPSKVAGAIDTAESLGNRAIAGKPSIAASAANDLGVDISKGRAVTGLQKTAEKFLRNNPEQATPFEAADVRTNEGIKAVGSNIADSIMKTNLSLEDQGIQIQSALKAAKTAAGQEVGSVHDAISQIANTPEIDAKSLEPIAQKFVKQLSIDNPDYLSTVSPENQRAVTVLQQFADSANKTLDFDTAGKLITQMNELIPDVPSSAGGALKQMSSALKEQMYQSLPRDLASRLKDTHARYAQVSQGLDQGIARKVIGTRINPTPPELVADFLSKANSVDAGNLRNLLGPERIPQVQRALLQNVIEKTADANGGVVAGNPLFSNWNKVNDGAKSLFTPDQLDTINAYTKAVQDINLRGPRNMPDTFAGSSTFPLATHTTTGVVLNLGKGLLMKMGANNVAKFLLEPSSARDLTKALNTLPIDRGAAPLGQRLLFAAHQSAVRDRQADASATTPQ